MFQTKNLLVAATMVLLILSGCAPKEEPAPEPAPEPEVVAEAPAEPLMAVVDLAGSPDSGISGQVSFTQVGDVVHVVAHVEGVEPGSHGFHVHETGDCSAADFTSAGGHFNPSGDPHGGPDDAVRHAGDLGNITVDDQGVGDLEVTSDLITVAPSPSSVIGKAVILHAGADDLESQPTGAAGARLACGVIGLSGQPGAEEGEAGTSDEGGV